MSNALTLFGGGEPSRFSREGREMMQVQRRNELIAMAHTAGMQLADLDAGLRKRYTENRMYDANDILNLARQLAGDDEIKGGILGQIVTGWVQEEQRQYRGMSSGYGF